MKFKLFLSLLCIMASTTLFAQRTISGTVDDKDGAVFLATIILYEEDGKSIYKATTTESSGSYEIKDIKPSKFLMEVRMLGYSAQQMEVDLRNENLLNIDVKLEESSEMLETVEVTAKVPLIEQKSDRLVVNVANNITSLNTNLIDVLKVVPGVIVVNDRLKMVGQSNFTVLINGKSTNYMQVQTLLREMPGDNVKSVEIIHQPGAEFEAAGTGPIINIILKKNTLFGTNGNIMIGTNKDVQWGHMSSLSLSHYQGKLNLNGSIGYRDDASLRELIVVRNIAGDIYNQSTYKPNDPKTFRANFSVDYDINPRQQVGLSTGLVNSVATVNGTNTTNVSFVDDSKENLSLITDNREGRKWNLFTINPYYQIKLDTNGQMLNFDFNVANLVRDDENSLKTNFIGTNNFYDSQLFLQPSDVNIFATRLDYKLPLSSSFKLDIGAKYSRADIDNTLEVFDISEGGESQLNNQLSNQFLYNENIKAVYSKLSFGSGDWSGTLGLRFEESQSTGNSVNLDTTLSRNISKVFPSFSIRKQLNSALGAAFAYSYRINRPHYNTLNPFVYTLDPFTSQRGNSSLIPALGHSTKFSLIYGDQPFFNVEYKVIEDALIEVTEQDAESGVAFLTTANLESHKIFNTSLYFPLDFIPGIGGYGGIIVTNNKFNSLYLGENFDRSQWTYNFMLRTQFKLPFDIDSEITGFYQSRVQEGIIKGDWLYGVNLGFSKKFLKDKLKATLAVEDVTNRFFNGSINFANMDIDIVQRWYTPEILIKLNYKFGNNSRKSNNRPQNSASEEINRSRK